jgi:hypothetical protein
MRRLDIPRGLSILRPNYEQIVRLDQRDTAVFLMEPE